LRSRSQEAARVQNLKGSGRVKEVARIGEAVCANGAQLGQAKVAIVNFTDVSARRFVLLRNVFPFSIDSVLFRSRRRENKRKRREPTAKDHLAVRRGISSLAE